MGKVIFHSNNMVRGKTLFVTYEIFINAGNFTIHK